MENSTKLQTSSDQVCNLFPKPFKKKNFRKQITQEEEELDSPSKQHKSDNKIIFSTESKPTPNESTDAVSNTLNSPVESPQEIRGPVENRKVESPQEIRGPVENRNYIRRTYIIDYQPDICKDYKQTGYCGFGLACKFAHIREDDHREIGRVEVDVEDENEDEDDNALPSECSFCHRSFVDPVVTKCKHYFCLHCALKNYSTDKRCFVCKESLSHNFNIAHEIKKKIAAEAK